MQETSAKSREHRMRVLEHQAKLAAERAASAQAQPDVQRKIPLIVEVRGAASTKQRKVRRRRGKPAISQPDLEGL